MNTVKLISTILSPYPETQAIYLFGSYLRGDQRSDSDLDIAVLLPPVQAKRVGSFAMSDLVTRLWEIARIEIDLVNLRLTSTVFQFEVMTTGKRIYVGDKAASEEFEALTLSFYQKLNEERAPILEAFQISGRAYPV
ncbi:MAG: type II toxin-antitoxin system antitoxin [Anaerolineales bacterium]